LPVRPYGEKLSRRADERIRLPQGGVPRVLRRRQLDDLVGGLLEPAGVAELAQPYPPVSGGSSGSSTGRKSRSCDTVMRMACGPP
jgi:hypothetical protein